MLPCRAPGPRSCSISTARSPIRAPGITACIRHALDKLGRACPDDDALATYVGPPLRGTLSTLLDTRDPTLIEEALAHYRARYDDVGLFENRVYDGVPEMLDATARPRAPMFVATAKPQHAAVRIVEHFGLARHFAGIYGAEPGDDSTPSGTCSRT